jgi:hypothetical protein
VNTSTTGRPQDGGWYEIRLQGRLEQRWSDWFDGLTLTTTDDGTTTLRGRVADQAALHGQLQRLRDLGLPLISVTRVEPDTAPDNTAPDPATPDHNQGDPS